MSDEQEKRTLWRGGLRNFLEQFAGDNKAAHSVEDRWLAAQAQEWLKIVQQVSWSECNQSRMITPDIKRFRLAEIEKARAELAVRDAVLAQEAESLL